MKLSANQLKHLRRIVEEPGVIPSGVCLGKGWNAKTFDSLRKRGLVRSDASTGWKYFPTEYGVTVLDVSGRSL